MTSEVGVNIQCPRTPTEEEWARDRQRRIADKQSAPPRSWGSSDPSDECQCRSCRPELYAQEEQARTSPADAWLEWSAYVLWCYGYGSVGEDLLRAAKQ